MALGSFAVSSDENILMKCVQNYITTNSRDVAILRFAMCVRMYGLRMMWCCRNTRYVAYAVLTVAYKSSFHTLL